MYAIAGDEMRILFLGKRHYTNQDALQQQFGRIYRLPFHWHKVGCQVHLFLLDYHGVHTVLTEEAGFEVCSAPVIDPRSIARLLKAARKFDPDIIVSSGDCFIGLLGLRLARRHKAKFVFDAYDDYRTFGSYRMFMGWDVFGRICQGADLVMYASKALAGKHPWASPWILVPNGVEIDQFAPGPMLEARASLGLAAEGPLIGYFGSMKPEYGIEVLIQSLEKVRSRYPGMRLLLCGRKSTATPIEGDWIIYRGLVPHAAIRAYMSSCDVLALPYQRSASLDAASSCKIAEYLSCRRPIVATRTPNFMENFPEQAQQLGHMLAEPGDVDTLACAIERQLNDPLIVKLPENMTWGKISERVMRSFELMLA